MIEVEVNCRFTDVAELCEKHVGPRKFYLHNLIGGEGWDVRPGVSGGIYQTFARFDDHKMASFIMLKLK
jgi:hypothetical protein